MHRHINDKCLRHMSTVIFQVLDCVGCGRTGGDEQADHASLVFVRVVL